VSPKAARFRKSNQITVLTRRSGGWLVKYCIKVMTTMMNDICKDTVESEIDTSPKSSLLTMQDTCKLQYPMLVQDILAMLSASSQYRSTETYVNETLYTFLDH
jgi:hypothetical protein